MESVKNESYNGGNKYEWEQSFEDLTVFIRVDPNTTKKEISVDFKPNFVHIKIENESEKKLKEFTGNLFSTIDVSESFWLLQDSQLEVHLTKSKSGEVWDLVFKGDKPLSCLAKEDEKKRLLLERFQKEHPRFDFSDAEMNGMVPEPRTFMKN